MADDAAAPEGDLGEETAETEAADVTESADILDTPDESAAEGADDVPSKPQMSHVRLATILGLVAVVALAALCGWLGFRAYQSHREAAQRNLYLEVGRQGAVNLTTIDFEHVDDDVKRILESSTGTFYDDFQARSQPFAEVVKQAKSKSVGTVTAAGIESVSDDGADVLVAVTV
jgi:Mce-associated membrane protein